LGINNFKQSLKTIIMKSIKLIIATMAIVLFSTSCNKADVMGDIGVQIGPVYIQLSFGGGQGAYYGYGYVPANVNTTVAYIMSVPNNPTAIAVFDQNGRAMGTVHIASGDWRLDNDLFMFFRGWNYRTPCAVLIQWDQRWTNAPWSGKIIG
jgi:hypothetical protein